jgi:SEC-C motif domain protein
MTDCYCGSGLEYGSCCAPYHLGAKIAATAETLMRSRYSAFVMRDEAYLLATWDERKRPTPAQLDLGNDTACWQRLTVIRCHKGREQHNQGTVEFKAYFRRDNQDFVLHEISRFCKNQGRWFYIDGAVRVSPHINTNT